MAEKRIEDDELGRIAGGGGAVRVSPDDPGTPGGGGSGISGSKPPIGGQPKPEADGTGGTGNSGVTG